MATGVVLDPLAQASAEALKTALEADFGVEATQKDIVSALVYCATAPQLVGMLIAFTKAKAARTAVTSSSGEGEPAAGE